MCREMLFLFGWRVFAEEPFGLVPYGGALHARGGAERSVASGVAGEERGCACGEGQESK